MKTIDASGPIYEGMWTYGEPFSHFKLVELEDPKWVDFKAYSQAFNGFSMVTGSYIDGPAHAKGLRKSFPMHEIDINRIFDVDAHVLKFNIDNLNKEGNRPFIALDDIKKAEKYSIPEGAIMILATGWGRNWKNSNYLTHNWFLKKEAIEYILNKKPFVLAVDTPYLDNIDNEQGVWDLIYGNDILVVAPLINIENIRKSIVKIYISPLNILNTTGLPCRVIIKEK